MDTSLNWHLTLTLWGNLKFQVCLTHPSSSHAQAAVSFCLAGLWVPCRTEQRQSPHPPSLICLSFFSFRLDFLKRIGMVMLNLCPHFSSCHSFRCSFFNNLWHPSVRVFISKLLVLFCFTYQTDLLKLDDNLNYFLFNMFIFKYDFPISISLYTVFVCMCILSA